MDLPVVLIGGGRGAIISVGEGQLQLVWEVTHLRSDVLIRRRTHEGEADEEDVLDGAENTTLFLKSTSHHSHV